MANSGVRADGVGVEVGQMNSQAVVLVGGWRLVGVQRLGGGLAFGPIEYGDRVGVAAFVDEAPDELDGYVALSDVSVVRWVLAWAGSCWGVDLLARGVAGELNGGQV